ncbi:tetratricopeptide repeat protein [uncultured Streptomyces sp.]|uniref:tetratricopeptide repeat protein n=1 Tax=uncultured Streptomyces sp. TaxID=174707 RepID=UPI002626C60D|nr:tetratricopeptide repeat protein [uncultured Streptomyces sp.]
MTDQAVDTSGPARPAGGGEAPGGAPSGFFGRERESKALREDIERAGLDTLAGRKSGRARVLLIAGRPGSGRSALAARFARELTGVAAGAGGGLGPLPWAVPGTGTGDHPDGVLRVSLAAPGGERVPGERTAREILGLLGIATPPGADEDELSEMVREALAVRRAVLLLDDAVDAEQVGPLLPDNPGCLVLATSTGPLTGIPDVRPCTLGGLDAAAGVALLAAAVGQVRITVDPVAAETLVEECGGQPAALVLAAGWLRAHPSASVDDLTTQLRRTAGDDQVRPPVRAFRLVHDTLPQTAARILRLLALAPSGLADAHTASALAGCSVSAARRTLQDFAGYGLLRSNGAVEPQYEVPGFLVPALRELLAECDRPAETELARARMLERNVRLLQSCRAVTEPEDAPSRRRLAGLPRSLRFPGPQEAEAWLLSRLPALLASARTSVQDGGLDTLARRLVSALVRALAAHLGTEAAAADLYGLHGLVLDVAERRELPRERAAALLNLADLDAGTGRTRVALERYRAALDAGREAKDPYATGRAMESVGGAYAELEDYHRAADWYSRALALRLTQGDRAGEARLYGRLGAVHTYAGRYGEALRNWRASAAGHRRLGDPAAQARALSEAARVQEYAGRPHESLATCREAVDLARRAEDVRLQAALQLRLADTLDRVGDPAAAALHRATADRLLDEKGSTCEIRSAIQEN